MLWRSSEIIAYGVRAADGPIGSVADLLIEDTSWTVRWAVVATGSWLLGRKVLLPPSVLGRPDTAVREFPVDLTRKQVEDSPGIDTDAPVSRQLKSSTHGHHGWASYWPPACVPPIGAPLAVAPLLPAAQRPPPDGAEPPSGDPDLRSAKEVTGYYVRATDGDIGHVEEFLVEDDGWAVRYVVVDTENWWPGRKVLVSPRWFRDVGWGERQVRVDLARAEVVRSPEYDPAAAVDRTYEERLHKHHGFTPYWT